jgi:hypothetical protein
LAPGPRPGAARLELRVSSAVTVRRPVPSRSGCGMVPGASDHRVTPCRLPARAFRSARFLLSSDAGLTLRARCCSTGSSNKKIPGRRFGCYGQNGGRASIGTRSTIPRNRCSAHARRRRWPKPRRRRGSGSVGRLPPDDGRPKEQEDEDVTCHRCDAGLDGRHSSPGRRLPRAAACCSPARPSSRGTWTAPAGGRSASRDRARTLT